MPIKPLIKIGTALSVALFAANLSSAQHREISGIYPHLAMTNGGGECGTGAVVPYAGKLWVVTYPPHQYFESDDKLYEIDAALNRTIRPESNGSTNANRLIHRESGKLIIGSYVIDKDGRVSAIPRRLMPGRLTGTARHLADPANKVYIATMEEGLYELDLNSMKVGWLIRDGNLKDDFEIPQDLQAMLLPRPAGLEGTQAVKSELHGYHGKGLYTGQGKLFYSNNGIRHENVTKDPTIPSGALAQWGGYQDKDWSLIRINQFTEITTKYGVYGAESDADPVWALGWDFRSVILGLCEGGKWTFFRLPKGSHSYDGSHGWNTEWPRIRGIGRKDGKLLATMHGTFWSFPETFSLKNSAGISPRSNYLKVVGDFCEWNGRIVFGCDDTAKKEFYNTRTIKNEKLTPGISNSNLWFAEEKSLDALGPALGEGSVWLNDSVKANEPSDPYLFSGYDRRILTMINGSDKDAVFKIQLDFKGDGEWKDADEIGLPKGGSRVLTQIGWNAYWINQGSGKKDESVRAEWIRIVPLKDAEKITAHFSYANNDARTAEADKIFDGLAKGGKQIGAYMCVKPEKDLKLGVLAFEAEGGKTKKIGYYELDEKLNLVPADDAKFENFLDSTKPKPDGIFFEEGRVRVEEDGKEYLLPVNPAYNSKALPCPRFAREVATERDIFLCAGLVYELPARNAQGMAKVRAVSAADFAIADFCSYRGMMVLSGLGPDALSSQNPHIIKSSDGKAAVWAGAIDDLWKLGKPRGTILVWKNKELKAGEASIPALVRGFDKKTVRFAAKDNVNVKMQIDIDGTGVWADCFKLGSGKGAVFPGAFNGGYWVRFVAEADTSNAILILDYE